MDNNCKTWLYDILNAINEIDSFFENNPRIFEAYQYDIKTKRAVERNIDYLPDLQNEVSSLLGE